MGRDLTLIRSSLVDGPLMIPVSRSENFFCTPATYSSTLSYPCFIAIAGVSLSISSIAIPVFKESTHWKGYSCPSTFFSQSRSKK